MSSYKTTLATNTRATVTFTSFGIYDLEAMDDTFSERNGTNAQGDNNPRMSSIHSQPGVVAKSQSIPTGGTPEIHQESKQPTTPSTALTSAGQLAKKILARPPSLNGPSGPRILMKPVELAPITSETADAEDTSDGSSSDAGVSLYTYTTSSGGSDHSSKEDQILEGGEPVMRTLTVPPWHYKSRRPNVCATSKGSEPRPLYTALDGPMRFPF